MDKKIVLLTTTIFGGIGSYVPTLFGDTSLLGGWSLLGGLVGGLFGVWAGVWLNKRIG